MARERGQGLEAGCPERCEHCQSPASRAPGPRRGCKHAGGKLGAAGPGATPGGLRPHGSQTQEHSACLCSGHLPMPQWGP